jgi:hypothetical protein
MAGLKCQRKGNNIFGHLGDSGAAEPYSPF